MIFKCQVNLLKINQMMNFRQFILNLPLLTNSVRISKGYLKYIDANAGIDIISEKEFKHTERFVKKEKPLNSNLNISEILNSMFKII